MKQVHFLLLAFLLACGPTKREKKISSNPSSIAEELVEKAGPDYPDQYSPEDVTLDDITYSG